MQIKIKMTKVSQDMNHATAVALPLQNTARRGFMATILFAVFLLMAGHSVKAQIKDCRTPCNLVKNGNFEMGFTGFGSDLPQMPNSCTAGGVCVASVFRDKCNTWPATGSGSGKFLAVDGSPVADKKLIWKKDLKGCCGMTYTFSFRAANIYGAAGSDNIIMLVNGNPICTVAVNTTDWRTYTCTYTGCVTSIALQQEKGAAKSDIGIDDIFFGFCTCECTIQ